MSFAVRRCTLIFNLVKPALRLTTQIHTSICSCKKKPLKPIPKNFAKFPVKGSIQYVARQLSDPYVKRRFKEGYRCRSVYKLKEIDDKYNFLQPGISVVDLGAAPGSWCQVAIEKVFQSAIESSENKSGQVIAVDLLRFSPLEDVVQLVGDFTTKEIQNDVVSILTGGKADVVLCDAAPNASGFKSQDHIALIKLAVDAARFAFKILKPGGTFLCKVWNDPQVNKLSKSLGIHFQKVIRLKPDASRSDSAELYLLCQKFFPKPELES